MKKTMLTFVSALSLVSMVACSSSNMNRQTPASMDNKTIEADIRSTLATDKITGLSIDVQGSTVTLSGHLTQAMHDKAISDAQKVHGVENVVDHIQIDQM